jgi:hypothetical protein
MDGRRVEAVTNLQEWFRHSLAAAAHRQHVSVEPATEHYMVNLMTGFARAENLYEQVDGRAGLKPLAMMLAEALESPSPVMRQVALQRLGDVSLFISGFFQDSLARKPVDVEYYARMGGSAYDTLSGLPLRTVRDHALHSVFRELAEKFLQCVELLAEVAQQARVFDERDLLRLYDVYLQTGSRRAREALQSLGVVPSRNASTRTRH